MDVNHSSFPGNTQSPQQSQVSFRHCRISSYLLKGTTSCQKSFDTSRRDFEKFSLRNPWVVWEKGRFSKANSHHTQQFPLSATSVEENTIFFTDSEPSYISVLSLGLLSQR